MAERLKPKRPDEEPGFWPEWREPTPLAQAIQYPLNDPFWQNRVINAYVRVGRAALRSDGGKGHD